MSPCGKARTGPVAPASDRPIVGAGFRVVTPVGCAPSEAGLPPARKRSTCTPVRLSTDFESRVT